MIGTTLGHYRILRQIGKGGMGEVYAAEDVTLGRTVAIKVLPAQLNATPEEIERLSREAKTVAALNHRSIVTLYSLLMPDPHGMVRRDFRLTRDEKTVYMSLAADESDIWMVTLGRWSAADR